MAGNGLKGNKDGLNNEAGSVLNVDKLGSYSGKVGIGSKKIIGTASNASAGKLHTYKTSVKSLNTGSLDGSNGGMGDKRGMKDRNDI